MLAYAQPSNQGADADSTRVVAVPKWGWLPSIREYLDQRRWRLVAFLALVR